MIGHREWGARILLIVGGSAIGLFLAWGSALTWRAIKPTPPQHHAELNAALDGLRASIFMLDPDVKFRLKPSHTGLRFTSSVIQKTNSRGMLGEDEVGPGPAGGNILFLGDSVTYGQGVPYPETFVPLLQLKAGSRFKLYNASCPAWSTAQEAGYFDKFARDLPWTAVVVMFYPNDLTTLKLANPDRDGTLDSDNLDFSELLAWQLELFRLRSRMDRLPDQWPLSQEIDYVLLSWVPGAWKSYENHVLAPFLDKNRGSRIIFVALPTSSQLIALSKTGVTPEVALFPQRRLADFCRRHGVPFIEVTEALTSAPYPIETLYVDNFYHLSENGHRTVADYLWPRLEALIETER